VPLICVLRAALSRAPVPRSSSRASSRSTAAKLELYATGVGSRCRGGSFNNNNSNNLRVDNRNDNNNPSNNNVGFRAANTPRSGELLGQSVLVTDRDAGSVPGESL